MTPQERDVIAGIFDRLKQAANQPRDPEAEAFIAGKLREQPYAPYAMAQSVYVQEQALTEMHGQIEQLQNELRELKARQAEPAPAPAAGGFLSGIFGGAPARPAAAAPARSVPSFPPRGEQPSSAWNNAPAAAAQPAPQPGYGAPPPAQPGAWGPQGAAAAQPPARGGGFLASALTTAAGVAGGMMVANALSSAFGGHGGAAKAAETAQPAQASSLADSVTAENAGKDVQNAGADGHSLPGNDSAPDYQDASYQDAGYQSDDDDYDDPGVGGDDDSWA